MDDHPFRNLQQQPTRAMLEERIRGLIRERDDAVAERDLARRRWDEYQRLAEATAVDLAAAEEEIQRLRAELRRRG